jgi:hypothetical protein
MHHGNYKILVLEKKKKKHVQLDRFSMSSQIHTYTDKIAARQRRTIIE